jgi:hypothetical protein
VIHFGEISRQDATGRGALDAERLEVAARYGSAIVERDDARRARDSRASRPFRRGWER